MAALLKRSSTSDGFVSRAVLRNVGNTARLLSILRSWLWSTTSFRSGTIWQGFTNAHMASSPLAIFSLYRKQPNDYMTVSIHILDLVTQLS